MIAIHRNSPIASSACQNRGRSRYSHCWSKKIDPFAQSTPKMLMRLAQQAADHDDHQRAEQPLGQPVLPAGLAARR